jgi:hypothetical protein
MLADPPLETAMLWTMAEDSLARPQATSICVRRYVRFICEPAAIFDTLLQRLRGQNTRKTVDGWQLNFGQTLLRCLRSDHMSNRSGCSFYRGCRSGGSEVSFSSKTHGQSFLARLAGLVEGLFVDVASSQASEKQA